MDDLRPLLAPLDTLQGVGPAIAEKLARVASGPRVLDLLFHLPEGYLDRRNRPRIADAIPGQIATLSVEVVTIEAPGAKGRPWRIVCSDGSGFIEIIYFARPAHTFIRGQRLVVSGKVDRFGDRLQLPKPDHVVAAGRTTQIPDIEPVWPLTAGLFPNQVRTALRSALALIPHPLAEWHDPALLARERWPSFRDALHELHLPKAIPGDAPRARLAYDELLAHQIAMAWTKARNRTRPGRSITGPPAGQSGDLRTQALTRFGHPPTLSQIQALAEIDADLAAPRRMLRLLQGDVGSGKTLVALLAMLRAVEAGHQAALMAPTEVLAKQHHRTFQRLSPRPVGLLTGSIKGVDRRRVLAGLANGRLPMVIGTHALFQDAVAYHDLAFAVIDEQHRFGVEQRMTLGAKGERTDLLVMTATPIPRTLLLTQWGEMDVSRLLEKPGGRQPITTTIHSLATLPDIVEAVGRMLHRHERVYWVCPMVSENEMSDLAAAKARHAELSVRFGDVVGLAHGQQEPHIRDRALADFAAGAIRLLVATTVIEVGVDVPEASVMVIEHAERFGLAQLHQLRGRVGRGSAASYCLLLHDDGLTETMRRRLTLLRDTTDGFVIADEDFRIRGGGDLLGKRQSGLPGYRMTDPDRHDRLIQIAARDAAVILDRDPTLCSDRGPSMRGLLNLFGRREGVLMLDAG